MLCLKMYLNHIFTYTWVYKHIFIKLRYFCFVYFITIIVVLWFLDIYLMSLYYNKWAQFFVSSGAQFFLLFSKTTLEFIMVWALLVTNQAKSVCLF
ncbi:hypothetical protein Hanom_Chr14g01267311 [Helianthus anomalus]